MEKLFHANGNQQKVGVATLISGKIKFKIECKHSQGRTLYNDQGLTHSIVLTIVNTYESIKIAGRNINNLRNADNTTLMAESEEEPKSLLMRVKEEN